MWIEGFAQFAFEQLQTYVRRFTDSPPAVVLAVMIVVHFIWPRVQRHMHPATGIIGERFSHTECNNPSCIRCQSYAEQQPQLRKRFFAFTQKSNQSTELARIEQAVFTIQNLRESSRKETQGQHPTVFLIPDLPSAPFPLQHVHQASCRDLAAYIDTHLNAITAEISAVLPDAVGGSHSSGLPSAGWQQNGTVDGPWFVLHFVNQGRVQLHSVQCVKCMYASHSSISCPPAEYMGKRLCIHNHAT
eukprot:m.678847 g.678847  ORF g.678847 m.678847 type:complete len:245 (+) comp22809_c0_seq9:296-1030(+)